MCRYSCEPSLISFSGFGSDIMEQWFWFRCNGLVVLVQVEGVSDIIVNCCYVVDLCMD